MKHYTFDIEETLAPAATKWARNAFGMSKPTGVKMSQMLWWRRSMYVYDDTLNQGRPIVRFYFKREAEAAMFKLRWS
jgi:hypothetical protein